MRDLFGNIEAHKINFNVFILIFVICFFILAK